MCELRPGKRATVLVPLLSDALYRRAHGIASSARRLPRYVLTTVIIASIKHIQTQNTNGIVADIVV